MTTGPALLAASLWIGAWLRGAAASDDLLEAVARLVPGSAAASLLPEVRAVAPDRTWLLLPRPGHLVGWPAGLPDPPEPAVLVTDRGGSGALVRPGRGRWAVQPCAAAPVAALEAAALTPRQARRELDSCLLEAAARLERLGLDRAASTSATAGWAAALARAPHAVDPAAAEILHRCAWVLDSLRVALADDGAAVTSGEARARAVEIRALTGRLEDVVAAVVGGLNARPVP